MANGKDKNNGANLGFEAELFKAADKLRGNMEPSRLQARRAGPDLPEIHLRCLRGAPCRAAGRRPAGGRGPGRIPRRQRVLGAEGRALVAPEGQRQAPRHRHTHRRRHARHREEQRVAQGRAAQGLRPPGAQQGDAGRADRPDLRHRAWAKAADNPKTCSAASTNTSSASSPAAEGKRGGEFYTPRSVVRVLVRDAGALPGPRL